MANDTYIFWDNSNIYLSAQRAAAEREGPVDSKSVRIQFDNLFKLARAGRQVGKAYCVGSVPPELRAVWDTLSTQTGIIPELYERGKESGKEQGVDQCLQVWMLRTLVDIRPPEVAVLLTGDGAGYADGAGFHADLQRMHKLGWGIEVLSWDIACKKALREWATKTGVYIPLEDHYESLTFIQGGRQSKPVNLTRRAKAAAKP
jgi:hypothetical protein